LPGKLFLLKVVSEQLVGILLTVYTSE